MFAPGAGSLLDLLRELLLEFPLVAAEERGHQGDGAAGVLKQRRVTAIEFLQCVVGGVNLRNHIRIDQARIDAWARDRGSRLCGWSDFAGEAQKLGAHVLLAAYTFFQIRQTVVRDGQHGLFHLACQRSQKLEILGSSGVAIMDGSCGHQAHFP